VSRMPTAAAPATSRPGPETLGGEQRFTRVEARRSAGVSCVQHERKVC
jgi:hypothetical protein